jgi:hypothetical protein
VFVGRTKFGGRGFLCERSAHTSSRNKAIKTSKQPFPQLINQSMFNFTSRWVLLLIAAIAIVQSVCSSSAIPPLEKGMFVFTQIVLPDATDVAITEKYTIHFQPTSETVFDVHISVANSMYSTMTINSTVATEEETILNVEMSMISTTLMMPHEAAMLVESAIGEILPTVDTVVVVENNDTTLTVTFEGDGAGILVLDQEL